MERVPAYILAGGQSRRFGSDKARALLCGEPLIAAVARVAQTAGLEVTVIADRAAKYAGLGLHTIADIMPGLGPLGGLYTLWNHSPRAEWALVLACDMAPLRAEWLRALVTAQHEGADAVLFDTENPQPLLACYRRTTAPLVPGLLREESASMKALLRQCRVETVPAPASLGTLRNVNRPQDLDNATAHALEHTT